MKLFLKNFNLCDPPTLQTDGQMHRRLTIWISRSRAQ